MKTTMARRIAIAVVTAAAGAVLLAGCAGESGGGSGGTSAGGDSIKIMAFGTLSQPPYALSQIGTAAQAAVDHVNAEGGVNGTQLELITCDDKMSPNGATACGQQAVENSVAAVVGSFTLFGDLIVPQLEAAQIPYLFNTAISNLEGTSDVSFSLMSAGTPSGAAIYLLKEQGCESVVFTAPENPQAQAGWDAYTKPIADNLDIPGELLLYPANETNFSAVAQQIVDAGDCVIYAGGPPDTVALITAIKQIDPDYVGMPLSTIAFPESTLAQLGSLADGIRVPSTFFAPSTGQEDSVLAASEMKEIDPNVTIDDTALNAYASVIAFAQAASDVTGDVTGESIIEVLNDPSTTIETGLAPPVNFAEDLGFFPALPRVAGSVYVVYKAEDGKFVQDGEPIDVNGKLGF
ncbi:ABC transporter substrate-binding protein [Microbacterium sp. LRZ72]|uniref:ABC transporter substrate-binding protein n=1 Tax=Microbacterium sp. LRZ72 TaxID=2942481 RepID=UPI0029A188EE|nr:ABC transporter substrate-binding protein [Microbacterium sp. LRZ72]MDX2377545.1 ABC transporter substrate-binding protein [Microbacterium sp. LRZ72]